MNDFIIHEMKQRTQEWHEFRFGKVGASDAASILGLSPWETKLAAWERFVFGYEKQVNSAMQRGVALEKEALEWANKELDACYQDKVLQKRSNPFLIASLDGYAPGHAALPAILEIKCPGTKGYLDALNGEIPPYYYAQLQHQMMIAEEESAFYMPFDGKEGVFIRCYRDEKYIEKLQSEEKAFLDAINDLKPPEPSDKDWVRITDLEASKRALQCIELRRNIKALEEELSEVEGYFKGSLEHTRCMIGDLKIQKILRKGAVDYAKIPALKGIDLEPYRKARIESWRFTF